ncbi:MAG: acyl-CoA thioesterase [Bacteroidales bacterium]|jgi:YbgC/YbaW family acyl-CoA thioester hydrolase|nr:acyl-CoA thioesterase [Bacteroidales bacterium]
MTDLDPLGHVNNGVIYSYYDMGRLHYLNQIEENTQWENIDKVIVHTECDFMESIFFTDDIYVETKITETGRKSIKMMQRIVDNNTGKIKSTCYSVLSGYDRQTNTSKEISETFKEKVKLFENVNE